MGKGVTLGRCRIIGRTVAIGDGTRIGDNVTIEGEEIRIGSDAAIESDARVLAKRISIGDETLIEAGVTIGGLQTSKSRLELGSRCVVLHRSYLNTTYPLVIEDDVGIGGYCMIFTHGLWQSAFEGYPVSFGPVTIRKGTWLPWHVFVVPGVEIGEGATIGAGSVVLHSIPPRALAVGTPARVVRGPPEYPTAMGRSELHALVRSLLDGLVDELRDQGTTAEVQDGAGLTLNTSMGRIVFETRPLLPDDVQLVLEGEASTRFWVNPITRDWQLDLSKPLHAALRLYLRRMGVRLPRRAG